jgi:hypothetical protein
MQHNLNNDLGEVISTKEVGVGCLWYPLGTWDLLEKFSTDVYQQWGIYLWHSSCKSWSFFAGNLKIGIIQKLIIFFHKCIP